MVQDHVSSRVHNLFLLCLAHGEMSNSCLNDYMLSLFECVVMIE